MLRRILRGLAIALVLILAAAYAVINYSGHDPDRWHVDPGAIELRGTPNEFLAAPPGTTQAEPDMQTKVYDETPQELLARFDAVARAQPRTQVVAGGVESGVITYVQRTEIVGFPDYVTVKAMPVEDGAGLVVYSRSRYGQDDWGVNRQRVKTWLGELGPPKASDESGGQPSQQSAGQSPDQSAGQTGDQTSGQTNEESPY